MGWMKKYQQKLMSAEEAVDSFIKDNDTVALGGLTIATSPLNAMFKKIKSGNLKGISLEGTLIMDYIPIDDTTLTKEQVKYRSYFFGGHERSGYKAGNVAFVPIHLSNYRRYMLNKVKPNVGVISMTPPDKDGYCNLGPQGSAFAPAILESAGKLIVQINSHIPRVHGKDLNIHVSQISAFVKHDQPLQEYHMEEITEIDRMISNHIIDLIPDGSCIQLGLGGTANAVGYGLKEKKDLGVHTEMFTESMAYLHKIGVINNSRKTFMPGVSVSAFTLGSSAQYEFVKDNKDLYFGPFDFTNSVENIAKNDNMISVNNSISIDLMGQACSESIGFRQFSGTGGQVDFVRGATNSKNGKSFIALSSAINTKEGLKSRIVLDLLPGGVTTTLRNELQYVVTEHGCVNLFGEDVSSRAKLLISIAHPQFRDELFFQAKKHNLIY